MSPKILVVGQGTVAQELVTQLATRDSLLCEVGEFSVCVEGTNDFLNSPGMASRFDAVVLCGSKPEAAATAIEEYAPNSRILDISQAHRLSPGWVYGRRENGANRSVTGARRVANPGCVASAATLLLSPLFDTSSRRATSMIYLDVTGGATMAGAGQQRERVSSINSVHPHIREIAMACQLEEAQLWLYPTVCPSFSRGIRCVVPLPEIGLTATEVLDIWRSNYADEVGIRVEAFPGRSVPGDFWAGQLGAWLTAVPHSNGVLAIATIDNLLKGAVETAVYNIRDMLS